MNKIEYLLTCLSEECGESTQVACKANRFGLDHVWPEKNETNRRILEREIADILGVAEELGLVIRPEDISAKRAKLRTFMTLSVELGTLDAPIAHCNIGGHCDHIVNRSCRCLCADCQRAKKADH